MPSNMAMAKILNLALGIEYATIIHFPRFVHNIENQEIATELEYLVTDSIHHADTVCQHLRKRGCDPAWNIAALPEGMDFISLLRRQQTLELETQKIYEQTLPLADNEDLARDLRQIIAAEQKHWEILEHVIALLSTRK